MTHFLYKKDTGEVSEREVIPIGYQFGDRDTVLCIQTDELDAQDRYDLDVIRKAYLQDLYDAGFGKCIRSFFLDNIEELVE